MNKIELAAACWLAGDDGLRPLELAAAKYPVACEATEMIPIVAAGRGLAVTAGLVKITATVHWVTHTDTLPAHSIDAALLGQQPVGALVDILAG